MMGLTHAVVSATGVSIALNSIDPYVLAIAAASSQIPDLDCTDSHAGRILYPIAAFIEKRWAHRTITHCLYCTLFLAIASLPLMYYFDWHHWAAVPLGHFFSAIADCFTKDGVTLFYPSPVRWVSALNPSRRLKVGSPAEYWVLASAVAVLLLSYNIQSSGGLTLQVNQVLGDKSGVEQVLNRDGDYHHIYLEVKGVKQSDRSKINSKFFLIQNINSTYLVQDDSGMYEIGKELIAEKLKAVAGELGNVQIQSLNLNDEDITALATMGQSHPNSAVYVTGTLQVDDPENLVIPQLLGQFQSVVSTGTGVNLTSFPLELTIQLLQEQYLTGTLSARIVTPRPNL